ncbi:MAG: Trk system potassium transporter TrkA [Spirochaetales bacterium]|nr:Trk system potassium transporter TrkA [Spirochaetales bacterium]
MRIIIAGAGDMGFHLARELARDNHHITVIDIDEQRLQLLGAAAEVLTIAGTATSFKVLSEAAVSQADLFLGVTSNEVVNICSTIMARKLGARQTLARVSNHEFVDANMPFDFKEIGIDHTIYPEELAAQEIVKLIERSAATDIHDFEDGKLTLIGLKLMDDAPILGHTLQDVMKGITDIDFRIVLIKRGHRTFIPSRDLRLRTADQIIVITRQEGLKTVLRLSGKHNIKFNNIMILGGGKIGRAVATMLQNRFNVKLIDHNPAKALELAEKFERALIISGDGRDATLLAEEGISGMDVFVAVTQDAETNIISCLMARELGVKKTMAYVENAEYYHLTQTVGINALINKKIIGANYIARLVRSSDIIALTSIHGMDAEVLEFEVPEGATITRKKIRDVKFPGGAIVGGVVRGDDAFIAVGDTQILPGDRVVVFALPEVLKKTEGFFQAR